MSKSLSLSSRFRIALSLTLIFPDLMAAFVTAIPFITLPSQAMAACPDFTIEGFARNTIGGCGGTVYTVTNLNDSGPGSLRDAATRSGPRIVRFAVSGTINLLSSIEINYPFLTIDGSTAPNGGIAIKRSVVVGGGAAIDVRSWEVIIRHIRVRPGDYADNNRGIFILYPDPDINPGAITYNVVIDHVSVSWFIDDGIAVYGAGIGATNLRDITFQYNIISEGLNTLAVGRGFLVGNGAFNVSVHHNLLAHNYQRHPEHKSGATDWVNNVMYNWMVQANIVNATEGAANGNWVGNYWKHGPNTVFANFEYRFIGDRTYSSVSSQYVADNKMDSVSTGIQDARIVQDNGGLTLMSSRFPYPLITTTSAISNYTTLLPNIGATLPCRDSVDQRVVNSVINRTGNIITSQNSVGGWPDLTQPCSGGGDIQAPTVSITAPTPGSTVSGTITVSGTASDNVGVAGMQFKVDGANTGAEDTAAPYNYSLNTTSLSNGAHTLTAVARDAAGNAATSAGVSVTVNNLDTQAPSNPTNLSATAVSSSQINLSWTASSDNVGVTGYRVERCQGAGCATFTQIAAPATNSYSDSTGLTASTVYTYRVRATDAVPNFSGYSNSANAPTQAPSPTITMGETAVLSSDDSGNGNRLLAQTATLSQTATLQSLSFYVTTPGGDLRLGVYDSAPGGGPGTKIAETASFTPTTGCGDPAGCWNRASVLTPVSPLPAGTYWLAYLPSSDSLMFKVEPGVGSLAWYAYPYAPMPATFSTSPTIETAHWSLYATLSTVADTVLPTVAITAPANGATVSGTITISGTAADNVALSRVEVQVDAGAFAAATGLASWTYSLNTTALSVGNHTITARATDTSNNLRTVAITVTVASQTPARPRGLRLQ